MDLQFSSHILFLSVPIEFKTATVIEFPNDSLLRKFGFQLGLENPEGLSPFQLHSQLDFGEEDEKFFRGELSRRV